jgi:hypothetical protein
MHSVLYDIRYACRSLRQRPLFTVIATRTLGRGIGVHTAIFSVFDAVVLRPRVGHDSAATPEVDTPYRQGTDLLISLAVQTGGDPRSQLPGIREIGIRAALGAERGRIAMLVLREGLVLGATGLVLGLIVSLATTRTLRRLLFGVGATDPLTYGGVLAFLGTVVLLACYLPARRASRVDPVVALRE